MGNWFATSLAIWAGDFLSNFDNPKQGKARSAHNPCGGISIRFIISCAESSAIWGARSDAKRDLKKFIEVKKINNYLSV